MSSKVSRPVVFKFTINCAEIKCYTQLVITEYFSPEFTFVNLQEAALDYVHIWIDRLSKCYNLYDCICLIPRHCVGGEWEDYREFVRYDFYHPIEEDDF